MGKVAKINHAADLAAAVLRSYEGREDWRRYHLGASVIGHKCDRYVWLSHRWAADPKHPGRMLRLFERGKREEPWIVEDLRRVGVEVNADDGGAQFRADLPGHLGGSVDGVLPNGIPGDERPMILECKTHSAKSFARLVNKGVKAAKPEHWSQVQVYMHGRPEKATLYVAACKGTDDLHMVVIDYDEAKAADIVQRGHVLSVADAAPEKLDPDQPPCVLTSIDGTRWPCQYFELCHGKQTPDKSCRTCTSVTAMPDGGWHCDVYNFGPCGADQREGCREWCPNPTAINADVVAVGDRTITVQFADGEQMRLPPDETPADIPQD